MPALLDLGVASVALLLLLAFSLLALLVDRVVPNVPVVGSVVRDALSGGLNTIRNSLWDFLKATTRPILDGLWRLQVWNMRGLGWLANALERVPGWVISNVQGAVRRATDLYNQAIYFVQYYYNAAVATAYQVGADARALAQALYNSAVAIAANYYSAAIFAVQSYYNQAVAHADVLYSDAVAGARDLFGVAEAGVAAARAEAAQLFTTAEADIGRLAGVVEADIANAVRGAEGYATQVAQVLSAAAATGVLAQVLPRIGTLEAEAEQCLRPLCDTVTPNAGQLGRLGQVLHDLEGLGVLALILATAEQAHQHPGEIASAARAVGRDVAGPVLAAARELVGV